MLDLWKEAPEGDVRLELRMGTSVAELCRCGGQPSARPHVSSLYVASSVNPSLQYLSSCPSGGHSGSLLSNLSVIQFGVGKRV